MTIRVAENSGKTEKKGGFGETVSVIVQALLLAVVIRTLLMGRGGDMLYVIGKNV